MIRFALLALAFASSAAMAAANGSFKMYSQPFAKPNINCDVHTSLKLDFKNTEVTATLVDTVSGACEIYVEPNVRTYFALVEPKTDGCGSVTYISKDHYTGRTIFKLTDNRTRVCQDLIPAVIEASEYDSRGAEFRLYSKDN